MQSFSKKYTLHCHGKTADSVICTRYVFVVKDLLLENTVLYIGPLLSKLFMKLMRSMESTSLFYLLQSGEPEKVQDFHEMIFCDLFLALRNFMIFSLP